VGRGWCNRHYKRWNTHGDPLFTLTPSLTLGTPEERFWPKVDAEGDCWEWTASKFFDGYGMFWGPDGHMRAHRFAWETLVGPIPDGLQIDHLCRNRLCCNPDHLQPTTHRVNVLRGEGPAAVNARKTHCKRNHEFTPENTAERSEGGRRCRQCHRERTLTWYHANKGK
jgi:hypothetical protein